MNRPNPGKPLPTGALVALLLICLVLPAIGCVTCSIWAVLA
ncbi:MAG: hypothetical protein NXI22_05200 [bacterium]|nr:hypothetical protein [bacterium]